MKNSKTYLFVLYSQNYITRALPILFNTLQKSLLKSSYPKTILAKFSYQKNPKIENFKPQKILWSSPSLEIPSTPPPSWAVNTICPSTKNVNKPTNETQRLIRVVQKLFQDYKMLPTLQVLLSYPKSKRQQIILCLSITWSFPKQESKK